MLSISPYISPIKLRCPECRCTDITVSDYIVPGIHVMAACSCGCCELEFYHDFPIGHALYYPIALGKNNQKLYDPKGVKWFSKKLHQSYLQSDHPPIEIKKIVKKEYKEMILLNCLDYLYGHVLLKLFNAPFYKKQHPNKGIIVLIPKSFEWMVPDYVTEIWSVNIKLSEARNWFPSLNTFVKEEVKKYERVFLSPVYSHPDLKQVNIEDFTGISPFDISQFTQTTPQVTFIYREDRLWHNNRLEHFLFLVCRKLNILPLTKWFFLSIQNYKIKKLFKTLRKNIPGLKYSVAGMGSFGNFSSGISDERAVKITEAQEIAWAQLYAQSHVVCGIHGSNMLLPTAHAAGFVEILPVDRIGNITQDVFCKYDDRMMHFMGRFTGEFASSREVAAHVKAIINGFEAYHLHNAKEHMSYDEEKKI